MKRRHDMPFGATVTEDGSVRFSLWAPGASSVELCLHDNHQVRYLTMERDQSGWCVLETDQAAAGTLYSYCIDHKQEVPDPASRFQPNDAHGVSQVIDPTIAEWSDGSWHGRPWEEAIIYELHLGTFTEAGNFRGAQEQLDYLVELGVTAIELMPLSDFPNGRNWGYDGVLPFAPDSSYGTVQELKNLIQAAHEREIMVFLDVVYNHFGPDGNYLHQYAPAFFTDHHQTPWGDAVNFDDKHSDVVRQFFIHNALYWLEEFHFDGLRLDAVHAIYDDSEPDFLEELALQVREGPGRERSIHLVLENDDNAAHYLERDDDATARLYTAQWNDDIHHCLHTLLTGEKDGYYRDYNAIADDLDAHKDDLRGPAEHLGRCLAEGFAWQGEPSPYRDGARRGEPSAGLPPTAFVSFLQNHDQVGNRALGERIDQLASADAVAVTVALRLLAPAPTLLFMGEEFASQTPFYYFCDFPGDLGRAVTEGRRKEFSGFAQFTEEGAEEQVPDPNDEETFLNSKLNWEDLQQAPHSQRLRLYRELIALRKEAIIPGLGGLAGRAASYRCLSDTAVHVSWTLRDESQLTMWVNLGAEPCSLPEPMDLAELIYCLPRELPDYAAEQSLPPWSIAVSLKAGEATSGSRRSTISALHISSQRPVDNAGANATESEEADPKPTAAIIPDATYRLQMHRDFNFQDVCNILPYLKALGVSHCYCSPYLKARPGSLHGYDIVNHQEINPEIGSTEDYDNFVSVLAQFGMGHILDMVPNHMGVMGNDNNWWLDVLENGLASRYGKFFDIDWKPVESRMYNKLLLPVLGDHYGNVLDQQQLVLSFRSETGSFSVNYYEHVFPIDPQQYPFILTRNMAELEKRFRADNSTLLNFQSLITALENLPSRTTFSEEEMVARDRDKELFKQNLLRLYLDSSDIADHIHTCLSDFNGPETDADPGARNDSSNSPHTALLHELLERQAYRLAYWRVASDEINYRRFFDINELACLRMEEESVFEETHGLVLDLVASGKVQGLRIDHPDGLYDPAEYFQRLQDRVGGQGLEGTSSNEKSVYVLAEKVLSADEHLRRDWSLHGTTGYDFSALSTGLFVESTSAGAMQTIYESFIGRRSELADVRYHAKKLIMKTSLAGEIRVLANQLNRIADAAPQTRDYTLNGLRQALTEVVACFPVYRTYVAEEGPSHEDRLYIEQAINEGARRSFAADVTAFDFIRDVLLWRIMEGKSDAFRQQVVRFSMQFQQYTAPVTAKGVEDTTFYAYNRLVALNDVGFDPGHYGVSVDQFHQGNRERLDNWPHSMLATSTHDSKRSGDVRARISVLSEIPELWLKAVNQWASQNERHKIECEGKRWPDRNIEYLLYQTLVGAFPVSRLSSADALEKSELSELKERIENYMLKAAKEAKEHTSWVNDNVIYEQNLSTFVNTVLDSANEDFLNDFVSFQHQVSELGFINSLAQTLLKLTVPGVPDVYQGDELWNFSLVDPDNRRPVDYQRRMEVLEELKQQDSSSNTIEELVANMADGRIKCYLIWKSLLARRHHRELFQSGNYIPLETSGQNGSNLCAFARHLAGTTAIVVVPRLLGSRVDFHNFSADAVVNAAFWEKTFVELPPELVEIGPYHHVFTQEEIAPVPGAEGARLEASALFGQFPVALLMHDDFR